MTTTTHDTPTDNAVSLAFAELDRLERVRAEFAAAKDGARAKLRRQGDELTDLRARFEAERPRAWSRVRRANEERRRLREGAAAEARAAAEVAHRERLVRYEVELEAKRLRLASLESRPEVVRPSRRLLEWSVPAAATVLVAFLGFSLLGEESAEARDPVMMIESDAPTMAPQFGPIVPLATAEAEPPPEPEPKATTKTKSKKTKAKKTKSKKTKSKSTTNKSPKPKKHSNPLVLDLGGDPLD